ncbi:MAG: hypothetical protein ACK551_04775 [Vampirovibrionales bacterium]
MTRVFSNILRVPCPILNEPASSHLHLYLMALPAEGKRLGELIRPLFELLENEEDRITINHWQPPFFHGNGEQRRRIAPPHVHVIEFLPEDRFNVIDRDRMGFWKQEFSNPETSVALPKALDWIFDALLSSDKDSFLIQQGSTKTTGRLNALAEKHPELSRILNTLFENLNGLPKGREWYPQYFRRERQKYFDWKHQQTSKH